MQIQVMQVPGYKAWKCVVRISNALAGPCVCRLQSIPRKATKPACLPRVSTRVQADKTTAHRRYTLHVHAQMCERIARVV